MKKNSLDRVPTGSQSLRQSTSHQNLSLGCQTGIGKERKRERGREIERGRERDGVSARRRERKTERL